MKIRTLPCISAAMAAGHVLLLLVPSVFLYLAGLASIAAIPVVMLGRVIALALALALALDTII
jgi:hypothetical protein